MYSEMMFLVSYLSLLVLGSRANTIAHTTRFHLGGSPTDDELRSSMTRSIALGVRTALEECKSQFKWDRWNCPESAFATRYENPASREMAFVSAITSAGIVHAVTRSCSKGTNPACGCVKDLPPPDMNFREQMNGDGTETVQADWEWRGCSDDISMGVLVARTFLSSLEGPSADVLSKVNFHNTNLGEIVVRDSIKPECKCHGISGSCTTKTCWRRVDQFVKIGDKLKHRYLRAARIQMNSARLSKEIPESLMVFIDESPDYCKPNATTGWPGTGGRICKGTGNSTDRAERRSCRDLCRSCGHQVRRRRVKESWDCNCKFLWCCQVECSVCHRTVVQRFCDDSPQRY